ncbi:MAG: phytoene desaturase [Crocinitomicaceae bacterium]|nr:phytoene desaturase [Crocinitomicaceae bacterium]
MKKQVVVVGGGISGLSSACYLAKEGHQVVVIEKNPQLGGRMNLLQDQGFNFDMGPSWYWMPEVFEDFFKDFGKHTNDYYQLIKLDPSYQIIWDDQTWDIYADREKLGDFFESHEKGAKKALFEFLDDAKIKYEIGMRKMVHKPGKSILEFADYQTIKAGIKLDIFKSVSKLIRQKFKNPKIVQSLEFPVLFLGAMPNDIPALYTLMNHADLDLGTFYPMGGMYQISKAMESLAKELGVEFHTGESVQGVIFEDNKIQAIKTDSGTYPADELLVSMDYHAFEQHILPKEFRSYDEKYWDSRVLAPSSFLYYIGVDKKIPNLQHHNLFFDEDLDQHAKKIYGDIGWPDKPAFYVNCTSKSDPTAAPEGKENLMILIPTPPGYHENEEETAEILFNQVIHRIEKLAGVSIQDSILVKHSMTGKDFIQTYNSYKGNAYGLANVLKQTAFLKPKMTSKKVKNLTYTGHLTVPGPGVPPAIISGKIAATLITKK